ncbi:MAG: hypothetical protein H7230_02800 [Candidatus Parcubacteria bacterium]|nr:hypothetical protein [Candidatus Paceibacterota bacterium]
MAVLRNIDVSNKIGVSPATVQNWIKYSLGGKIHLDLTKIGNRHFIEDNLENMDRMQKLKNQGVKYRSKTDWSSHSVNDKLYEVFTDLEIVDLMHQISFHKSIPLKYSYTDAGIKPYREAILEEVKNKTLSTSLEQKATEGFLDQIISGYVNDGYKINFVEIGFDYQTFNVGENLKKLVDNGHLHKYISISHSAEMHRIRKKAIHEDMKLPQVDFVAVKLDFETESMQEVLWRHKQSDKNEKIANICLLFKGAISNFKQPETIMAKIAQSLTGDDTLLISTYLTDLDGRDKVERDINISANRAKRHDWLFKLLNVYKNAEYKTHLYDTNKSIRTREACFKDFVEVKYKVFGYDRSIKIKRDDVITYFYSKRFTVNEFTKIIQNSFRIDQLNLINDEQIIFCALSLRSM